MSTPRGRLIDIGGRRLRLVAAGPDADPADARTPTVLLEAGAFGFSADWGVVQEKLAALGVRSLAYDRAGLGLSDAAAGPRDGEAVLSDLERLLEAAGEAPPYIVVGHSMAGLRVQLLAARHPGWIEGVVLVDASTPDATQAPIGRRYLRAFAIASRLFSHLAGIGLLTPFARHGDRIGLTGEARAEKLRIFPLSGHNRAADAEVTLWMAAARQARAAGTYDPATPMAVVTAGRATPGHPVKAMMTAPAQAAAVSYVKHVEGARHATLLGEAFADEVVAAVLFIANAAKTKAAGSPRRPSKKF
jgi:pimeloyl-ACP methyl ester carboxylesterase